MIPQNTTNSTNTTDERKDQDTFFMNEAVHWSTRSTCSKWTVGCILVLDGRVISTGYNGVVSKAEHCCDYWKRAYKEQDLEISYEEYLECKEYREAHRAWSKRNEIHAEQNAILFAARNGYSVKNTFLYTSLSPCIECAKCIKAAGILKVYYGRQKSDEGIAFLTKHGVECIFVPLVSVF